MAPAPPSGVLAAAARWLYELHGSSVERAHAAFASQPRYRDLTATQYAAAFQWLQDTGLMFRAKSLPPDGDARHHRALTLVFEAAVADAHWLSDAAGLVTTPDDLPLDVANTAQALGLAPADAFAAVHAAAGKVDTSLRVQVGLTAETALVATVRTETSCVVEHVALLQDGLGYDVAVAMPDAVAHLEVKGTTRRGRLTIYLSRNEFEVMRVDPCWHLIAVLVDTPDAAAAAVATVDRSWLTSAAPADRTVSARWETARFAVPPDALTPGIPALVNAVTVPVACLVRDGCLGERPPAWFPN